MSVAPTLGEANSGLPALYPNLTSDHLAVILLCPCTIYRIGKGVLTLLETRGPGSWCE